jgi:hypothetical protein
VVTQKSPEPESSPGFPRPLVIVVAAICLLGWFSKEIGDPDFWWHLMTGEYIAARHKLPVPDPFAFTTAMARPAYPAEAQTRQFNLTHEWLAQLLMYAMDRAAGFPGIVLFRAAALTAFCALAGLIAYARRRVFWAAIAAAFAAASVAHVFAADRPYQVTFLLLALTWWLAETRRWLWLLPPLFLVWANCHGGFFLGWIVLGACSAEALWSRKPDGLRFAGLTAICILICGLNPNGFRIFPALLAYRGSFLQSRLLEWARPSLWPPSAFSVLLIAALAAMLWAGRRVRLADWLIFAVFAAAALTAQRNFILIGLAAPVFLVAYLPWSLRLPAWTDLALLLLAAGGLAAGIANGGVFQFRAAGWRYPVGAADFLRDHHVTQPMFNTYEFGGYLIWRLWPQERVFIDGRALSESVFLDYARILYNHDESDGGKTAAQLLDEYGVQVIVMNTFEPTNGLVYNLAPALADPHQTAWKLVYEDAQAIIFMRTPPPGVTPINSLQVLTHMEDECALHLEHEPQFPRCARALGQVFSKIGDFARARKWIGEYLSHPHAADPEAEEAFRRLSQ